MKSALVLGAGGFIGSHMVTRLKAEGYHVVGVDLKKPDFSESNADEFVIADLRETTTVSAIVLRDNVDEIYQFAACMGGAGYIFTGDNDADIMHGSAMINLNLLNALRDSKFTGKIFYSSSACIYPYQIQRDGMSGELREEDAYPAFPDSEYGWEKIFSERLYDSYRRNYGLNVRVARFHNIFGPEGTWEGGKEKAPAAICRKVAEATDTIEVWGDGRQRRSFLYVDECIEGVRRLMESDCYAPINIGSSESVSINKLVEMVCDISGKQHVFIKHIDGPEGVRSRNSNNEYVHNMIGWAPSLGLKQGLMKTYQWIEEQVKKSNVVW